MKICDAHCDTMLKISENIPYDFSFETASSLDGFIQIFACFTDDAEPAPFETAVRRIALFHNYISSRNDAEIAYTPTHAREIASKGKVASILALENCLCLEENYENLYSFYNMGIRAISLTWNEENAFAHGCNCNHGGLKPSGVKLIDLADKLGVLVDLSHLNEQSFDDVINLGKGKLFASHSSARALCDHPRNLTDKQIYSLYRAGGIICVCPNPPFISDTFPASKKEYAHHLRYISDLTEGLGVGIGSDTDGISICCDELKSTSDLVKFSTYLSELGFSNNEISNIFSCNFERFLNILA
ncbi:MAG: membrane dipeptidase [Bacillota bacterium]|nr:membrane dipeptidase [Bacillota bacterium]